MDDQAQDPATRTPRWVKVFAIIAAVVVALLLVMLFTGHGPGRHMNHGLGAPATIIDATATQP